MRAEPKPVYMIEGIAIEKALGFVFGGGNLRGGVVLGGGVG
jgi:hypothetical protein